MASTLDPPVVQGLEAYTGPSVGLWTGIDRNAIDRDRNLGFGISERFVAAGLFATDTSQAGAKTFQDTSVTIQGSAVQGGSLAFATPASDNNEGWHQLGANVGSAFSVSLTSPKELAHEQYVKIGTIVETGLFIGLMEEGCAVNSNLADNTGALADKDAIGFHAAMHASVLTLNFVYKKAGQTAVTLHSAALVPAINTVHALGFRYRNRGGVRWLESWVDGARFSRTDLSTVTAAGFPFDQLLSPIRGLKSGEAGIKTFTLFGADTYQKF